VSPADITPVNFYIAVHTGRFIRRNRHDLARPEKSTLGVDFVGGKGMPFQRRSSQRGAGPRLKGYVADLERRSGNLSFRFGHRSRGARSRDIGGCRDCCRHAQASDEIASIHPFVHVDHSCIAAPYRQIVTSSRFQGVVTMAARRDDLRLDSDMQKGPP
jgi:hypothetical protein